MRHHTKIFMTFKKENTGGKKFQGRLPDEKPVKVARKRSVAAPKKFNDTKGPKSFGTGRFKKEEGDATSRPYTKRKDGDRNEKPYTSSRPYSENKFKKTDSRSPGSFKRKEEGDAYKSGRTTKPPYAEGKYKKTEGGTSRPYTKRTDGDKFDKPYTAGKNPKSYGDNKFKKSTGSGSDRPYSKGAKTGSKFGNTRGPGIKDSSNKKYFKEEKGLKDERPSNYKGRGKSFRSNSSDLEKGKTLLDNEEVRLNRYIANSGMCSRREADVMIEQGLVKINGEVVSQLGTKVNKGDDVRVDGKRISPEKAVYILLNKPKGYITSTSDPDERATVMDLIDLPGKERIYPVGRLDRNTTGVLLLTNDGELAQKLMHPSFEIKKIYRAKLDRKPSKDHLLSWVSGVELEDGFMSFEQCGFVDEEDDCVLGLEVHSGRNRIVRRMFEHFGYEVMALDRVMLGEFDHLKLGRGKWRFLGDKEIAYVERLKRMKGKRR